MEAVFFFDFFFFFWRKLLVLQRSLASMDVRQEGLEWLGIRRSQNSWRTLHLEEGSRAMAHLTQLGLLQLMLQALQQASGRA